MEMLAAILCFLIVVATLIVVIRTIYGLLVGDLGQKCERCGSRLTRIKQSGISGEGLYPMSFRRWRHCYRCGHDKEEAVQ
jgi:hypothetical protein